MSRGFWQTMVYATRNIIASFYVSQHGKTARIKTRVGISFAVGSTRNADKDGPPMTVESGEQFSRRQSRW
jgi:hypothetical protein